VVGVAFRMVPKCLRGVTAVRRYLGFVSKFLGFLLGVAVALAGPAVFGVLAAPGGIELDDKEMALAFGIGALIFWTVVSYFSGAGALGAFVAFGTLVYCWLWIPNRTTNFLNDVPGVTSGMIAGSKQYTLNGLVPILAVISLVYGIQLIVRSVQRRRRERADAERLQREQEAAQAQQEADVAAVYPVAGSTYQPAYGGNTRFDDLFDDEPEPEPVRPRNQADEQTAQFPVGDGGTAEHEHTAQFPQSDAQRNDQEETVQQQPESKAPDEHEAEPTPAAEEEPQPQNTEEQPKPQNAEEATKAQTVEEPTQQRNVEEETKAQTVEDEPEPQTAEPATKQNKVERDAATDQVGSQYRERMDNPEDTGEFHLAFENPVVKPA
jgi:hypothetical protein